MKYDVGSGRNMNAKTLMEPFNCKKKKEDLGNATAFWLFTCIFCVHGSALKLEKALLYFTFMSLPPRGCVVPASPAAYRLLLFENDVLCLGVFVCVCVCVCERCPTIAGLSDIIALKLARLTRLTYSSRSFWIRAVLFLLIGVQDSSRKRETRRACDLLSV